MRGFTLVEILVASLIMSIIMAAVFVTLSIGERSWFAGDVTIQLRDQTMQAVATMNRELSATRPSRINIVIGASSNTITFSIPNDNNGDGRVVDNAGNIEWSGNITYLLNNSNQIVRNFGGASTILGNDIIGLLFTRTQDSLIQVDITASKTSLSRRQIQDAEQVIIKLRN